MWRRAHVIGANPANPRLTTTRLFISTENTTAHGADGLFMNDDGNAFSACVTREGRIKPVAW